MVHKTFESFKKFDLTLFIQELSSEWNYQDNKFPNRTHSLQEWFVLITEEIGEIAKEILELDSNEYNFSKLYKEIIQAITLLIRLKYTPYSISFNPIKIII